MSFLSQPKQDRNGKAEPAESAMRSFTKPADNAVSIIGRGMQVTGNIVCTGQLQISGRVLGDIHAAHLTIAEGAKVEGKIVAPETVVQGTFNGSIHGNVVRLENTAVVDGEVFNRSLAIEQNAKFEGVSRRLDKAVEGPSAAQVNGDAALDLDTASIAPAPAAVN